MNLILAKRFFFLGAMNIWRHRMRSALTILGIVFGVCSVIAMLAIGEGASAEALEQIRRLGPENIIIRSVKPPQQQSASSENSYMVEYGLTYQDAESIVDIIPDVDVIVPMRAIRADVIYDRRRLDANVIGAVPWYPQVAKREVARGRFVNNDEMNDARNVCVLSAELADNLFTYEDPLGKVIHVQDDVYRVIGVMAPNTSGPKSAEATLMEMFVPLTAARTRFGEIIANRSSGSYNVEKVELHELIVKAKDETVVLGVAEIVRGILERQHKQVDYAITVPLDLLRQARETKRIFNIVLGSIAAISLLVGGIGIMNIMLASVTERTREIGIRRALGARRRDIIVQFLTETVLLSGFGGVFGLGLGVLIPTLITAFADMRTVITWWSLVGALGISVLIGVVFGLYPAWQASRMNPITALRHE